MEGDNIESKAHFELDQVKQFNEIVVAFQNEQSCYLQELEIVAGKIKTIFDNPKSGVNGDTVDNIFGNISEIVKVETSLKSSLEEMKIIASPHAVLAVGSVLNYLARTEQLEVYVYYGNNYSWSTNQVESLKKQKDSVKYTFEDCVKLGFSEDTITILLDVLLFKPIQHITYVFDTIRDLISCLDNVPALDTETQKIATIQKELLSETLCVLENTESAVQDVMDRYYDDYRYYPLYLVPRASRDAPHQLLFRSYMCMIVAKKAELRLIEVTEETITICILDKDNRDIILIKQRYPISQVLGVKDLHNDINQFSISLHDQVIQLLPAKPEDKDDVVVTLTILLSRRVFLPPSALSQLRQSRSMYSEYDEVYSGPSTVVDPLQILTLECLVERLILGAVTDPKFTKEFFTVFKLFITSGRLLGILQDKFNKYSQEKGKDKEMTDKTQKLKVFGLLKSWLLWDKQDFLRDGLLSSNLAIFLDSCKKVPWLVKWVRLIERILEDPPYLNNTLMREYKREKKRDDKKEDKDVAKTMWYLTKDPSQFSLLTLHPTELARQITLIEHSCFSKMRIFDIIVNGGEAVSKLREFQDRYSLWMRRSIVETKNMEERTAMFINMFHVLQSLHSIRNYSGLMAVYNVIQSAEIYRLKHSIRQLLFKFKDTLSKIEDMSKNNYGDYWKSLETQKTSAIPMIGLYSHYVKHSNMTFVNGDVVNFEACLRMSDKIEILTLLQKRPHTFSSQDSIKQYLLELCPYERKTRKEFLSDLYDKSLTIEPFGGPPGAFSRITEFDLSKDPIEFFGWKSTSVKPKGGPSTAHKNTDKFNALTKKFSERRSENESDDEPIRPRLGSTLTKSKSFCSRRIDEPPPLPPRVTTVNKSNCLSRSRSFNMEDRSPYDMYVLPDRRRHVAAELNDRSSPVYVQNYPLYGHNSPVYGHNSPVYGQNSPVYGHSSPVYGQNSPVYGQNSPVYGQNSPIYRDNSPIYAQAQPVPQIYEQMQSPQTQTPSSQNKPKKAVRPNIRPSTHQPNKVPSSPTNFARNTVKQSGQASPSPPLRRRRIASSKSRRPKQPIQPGSDSPPPALPVKTRNTLQRRAPLVRPVEYDVPDESYDTIENYPMRPPPIPPKAYKPPPIPPRN